MKPIVIVPVLSATTVGANEITTVHVDETARLAEQVPPVPGYAPPLNENGATKPEPVTAVAALAPEFVRIKVASVTDVVARVPKS